MDASLVPGLAKLLPQELVNPAIPQAGQGKASAKEAAQMFEGMLMAQIFQAMRKTVPHSGLFGDDSQARTTYEYLLDQAVMEHSVNSGKGWGLSDRLEAAWSRSQPPEKS
jgi:Rod binding domain-containing protein